VSSTTITVGCRELRSAAVNATGRGWPVVPGTYLGTDRHWHGRNNATRLCPISDTWRETPITARVLSCSEAIEVAQAILAAAQ
jgi:hypothetical protein